MRRSFLGLAAALTLVTFAPSGRAYAQTGGVGSDPFSFYYGYYLPHQSAIAATPTPMDTINQNIAQRQRDALTDRSTLYDPASPFGEDEDPLAPYSGSKRNRTSRTGALGHVRGLQTGGGPSMYYNRTARYFPDLKVGRGPNRNLAAVRGGRGGGAGMSAMGGGMPSMPGPR